jgi:hypothetical protein
MEKNGKTTMAVHGRRKAAVRPKANWLKVMGKEIGELERSKSGTS